MIQSFGLRILFMFIPPVLKKQIENRPGIKPIIINIGWLFFDKFFRMGVGMIVGALTARYLAPEKYGIWNYAIAFSSLFGSLAALGIDRIAVREIVKKPEQHNEILGSIFYLRLSAGILAFVISVLIVFVTKGGDLYITLLVAMCSSNYLLQSVQVIDFYYQAEVKSKYTVYAQNIAFFIIAGVKVVLIILKAPLIAFVASGILEVALGSFFFVIIYSRKNLSILKWRFNAILALNFLRDSWPYILTGISCAIYMRIDQIMIGNILNEREVGIYSVAVKISEIWFFIPTSIVASLFPLLVKSKLFGEQFYLDRLQRLCDFLTVLGIFVAIVISIFSNQIIELFYGKFYIEAGPVLTLHVWTGAIICMGAVGSAWTAADNLQIINIIKSFGGAIINILLNIYWIPKYGIKGAAFATVMAQFVTALIFYNRKTWEITKMELKSLLFYNTLFRVIKKTLE
jgi:polysaccharide transporter, PST family